MIHHMKKVLELASVLYGELAQCVHVQQVVVDLTTVTQGQGKAVHLGGGVEVKHRNGSIEIIARRNV